MAFKHDLADPIWHEHHAIKTAIVEVALICDTVMDYMKERGISGDTKDVLSMVDLVLAQANYIKVIEGRRDD